MPNERPKQDVIVHYDEQSGELAFYTVSSAATESLRRSSFGGVRPSVEELRFVQPSEAMLRVGGTVLALLDLSSGVKLGITDQRGED